MCAQSRTEELVYEGIENCGEQMEELAHFIKVTLEMKPYNPSPEFWLVSEYLLL